MHNGLVQCKSDGGNDVKEIERPITTEYDNILSRLNSKRNALTKICKEKAPSISSHLLYKTLVDSIFPMWYGASWDFNGISNIPGQGEIACGYFVSTTLKHAGFNLNRYRLAQQAATVIITELVGRKNTSKHHSSDAILKHLKKQKDGLYVVGLDYHVGFLIVEDNVTYFCHSDYVNLKTVREKATDSHAFNSTNLYVLGEITHNPTLMNKWLSKTKIY